jgi:two-component system alkaline phosphatase synthesis response regulator PhoP
MAKKILIADDEDNIRGLVVMTLEDEGFELHQARDGNEALDKARELKPDLIVLDVMMPGKVGYEVCEELKNDPATKDIYVIFLSSRTSPSSESSARSAGGDEWLYKPFDPGELRVRIKKALEVG